MEEDKILINRELYDELSSAFEKVEAVQRLLDTEPCNTTVGQIIAVLGIHAHKGYTCPKRVYMPTKIKGQKKNNIKKEELGGHNNGDHSKCNRA